MSSFWGGKTERHSERLGSVKGVFGACKSLSAHQNGLRRARVCFWRGKDKLRGRGGKAEEGRGGASEAGCGVRV